MSDAKTPGLKAAYALDTPDDNRALYREWAATYDDSFAAVSGYRSPQLTAEAYVAAGGDWPVLDAGCGTGLLADHLPHDAIVDGLDISPEMLAVARSKGRYRALMEADLTRPPPSPPAAYAGLVSSGTFTHGHVGPEALPGLVSLLRPGAKAALMVNTAFFEKSGFQMVLDALIDDGAIANVVMHPDRMYAEDAAAPEDHRDDLGYVMVFDRI